MTEKIFKTIDEQTDILKKKGLIINDEKKTREILLRENYFFISGYRHLFMNKEDKDKFLPGTTFEELYATFLFDRAIRNTFFKNILIVENNIKSITSYQLSKKYGFREKDYLNPNNFSQDSLQSRQVYDVLNKVKRQIRVNGRKHTATFHYIEHYGYIPFWILVKVLSFGIMAEFYDILKYEDQAEISKFYNVSPEILGTYLSLLSNFRNVCAHEDILYDHRTQRVIPDSKFHRLLNIPKDEDGYIYGKNDLFSLVIMLKVMLSKDDFDEMIIEISREVENLDKIVNTVPLDTILNRIGFPNNWKDIKDLS
ncbi:abi-like protein [Firmicutes bacterium CAG:822]|nr:abi-like protein [Firmicutes bacterium CAG:822]